MMDLIYLLGLKPIDGINFIIMLIVIAIWAKVVNDPKNPIKIWHFLASKGADGIEYGDLNNVGVLIAMAVSTLVVLWYARAYRMEWWLFGLYLLFMTAPKTFANWFRVIVSRWQGPGSIASLTTKTSVSVATTQSPEEPK